MPGKVTLVRGDGTLLEATPEQASRLALLGYKEETPEQAQVRSVQEAREDYYTSTGQKILTGIEGLGAGATFGGTDYLFGDDDTKARAHYNPGTRIGTEILGAVAPLLISGGESAAVSGARAVEEAGVLGKAVKFAPTNLLSDAAKAFSVGKEGSLAASVTKGIIEGGAYGAAGAADHAYLDGDPITAEAVWSGIGWGALAGGALSAVGHGIEKAGKAAVAAEEAATKPAVPHGALESTAKNSYGALRGEVSRVTSSIKEVSKAANAAVEGTVKEFIKHADDVEAIQAVDKLRGLYRRASDAATRGKSDLAEQALAKYDEHVAALGQRFGIDVAQLGGSQAIKEAVFVKAAERELSSMPQTVQAFSQMSPAKIERLAATFEKIGSLPAPNSSAITEAISGFAKSLGVDVEQGGLRALQKVAKQLYRAEGKMPVAPADEGPSLGRKLLGYALGGKAYVATRSAGLGAPMAYAAYRGTRDFVTYGSKELFGFRAAAQARVRQAAASFMPAAGKTVKMTASPVALATTLFGEKDDSRGNAQELAMRRAKEIEEFATTAKDTLYRAVEPLSVKQPALAPVLHASLLTAFQALHNTVPKDPGVISRLKSIWKPSDIEAIVLAKRLEVFHDPVGTAELMLRTGQFDPIKIESLKEMAPNTWQDLRLALLERVTDPEVASKLSYQDQIGLSTMLDIPLHSSMAPQYIATSQQLFMDRNQPLQTNPRIGANGGIPSPDKSANATQAQKSEAR